MSYFHKNGKQLPHFLGAPPLIFYTDSEIMVPTSAVSAPSENHVDRLNQTPYMF